MTRDDILSAAREAGFVLSSNATGEAMGRFARFAALVAAAELRRLYKVELAYLEWQEKTMWVQDTAKAGELGMHRADVLRTRIEHQNAEIKQLRSRLAEDLAALDANSTIK